MIDKIIIYILSFVITLNPVIHLQPGLSFNTAARLYYTKTSEVSYGYATRYGSDDVAMRELYWQTREIKAQQERGYILPGGGYGYTMVNGKLMLVDSRSSLGYQLLADGAVGNSIPKGVTEEQKRLLSWSNLNYVELSVVVDTLYEGIIFTRSPNDIGHEFCLYDLAHQEVVGLVIVGGAAARNDWTYYGPSVNDYYNHQRLGMRALRPRESQFYYLKDISPDLYNTDFYWIADLSDSVYDKIVVGMGATARLIALVAPRYCK